MAEIAAPAAQPVKAALWMTGALVSFSSMAIAGRELTGQYDTFEMMLYRSVTGLIIVLIAAGALGRLHEITARHMPLHIGRNLFHFSGQNLWFFAVGAIPLAQVFALEFTSPLWVMLVAPFVLGERWTGARVAAAVIGFAGVLVVLRPGGGEVSAGVIAAGAASLCFAATFMFTKLLTRRVTTTCILFWLTFLQVFMGFAAAGYDGAIAAPTMAGAPWLLLIGCAGLLAHLCVTNALSIAPATVVVPMDFLRLPLIALVGMALYGEALDPFVLFGAALIFMGNYLNIWAESRRVTVL